jgi:hypothetical protein
MNEVIARSTADVLIGASHAGSASSGPLAEIRST